jgi:LacI family transcriptional regulator
MSGKPNSVRVTLANVAERAGVSTTTVSLILSNREEYIKQFAPETVEKVRKSAKSLGYRANLFASGLPTRASPFFAVVIRDIGRADPSSWHAWAFEGDLLAGVVEMGMETGLYPIVATVDQKTLDAGIQATEKLITGGVFGAIVRSPGAPLEKFLIAQIKKGERILVVFPDQLTKWPQNSIAVDNVMIGEMAAQLLAKQQCRRWGIVRYKYPQLRESHKLRIEGFTRVAKRLNVPVEIIRLPREPEEFSAADLAALRKAELDGLFGLDSVLSVDALLAAGEIGQSPLKDFMLVGVNCSRWQSRPHPRITSVDVSWREVGRTAVKTLSDMAEAHVNTCDAILLRPHVVPGETCPVSDALLS